MGSVLCCRIDSILMKASQRRALKRNDFNWGLLRPSTGPVALKAMAMATY